MNQSIIDDNKKRTEIQKRRSYEEKVKKKKERRRKNIIYNVFLVVFAAVFLFSGGYLLRYYYYSRKSANEFRDLKALIQETPDTAMSGPDQTGDTGSQDPGALKTTNTAEGETIVPEEKMSFENIDGQEVQSKFSKLYVLNHEFSGWLTIDGTNVDYPVMYTPYDEEKYLHNDFNGDYSFAGTLFMGYGSEPSGSSDNILIYGHNMKDESMFHDLRYYFDQDYFEKHKYIHFDTIYGNGLYEIISVFHGQILDVDEEGFRYYNFYTAYGKEEFDSYVANVKSRSYISTDTTAEYGDRLLTLSTCASVGSDEGKRYVVVAKRISYDGK